MRARALLAAVAVVGLLATGCGATGTTTTTGTPHHDMSGMNMNMNTSADKGPSGTASMICGREIRTAVKRTFALPHSPQAVPGWSKADRIFSCSYRLPRGSLVMSVQDSLDKPQGRLYFDALRHRLPGATAIRGMENFGFPAFRTATGNVVFLKDGKTLHVDASAVARRLLPPGFSRADVAYSVASAVIACWKE
ncbi:MAG: hypothetical protein M3Y66_02230 [Actinomycetota bacterium]|nr:hypothetical protein [Actinomycetota bacterium]